MSPYSTQSQKTVVRLASAAVESHSELTPTSRKGATITYGPYEDVAPFAQSGLRRVVCAENCFVFHLDGQ